MRAIVYLPRGPSRYVLYLPSLAGGATDVPTMSTDSAGVAQLVEHLPSKQDRPHTS